MKNNKEVDVEVYSFKEFFEQKNIYPLAIDSYQRSYVWNTKKIEQLIDDLTEYLDDTKSLPYYMGSIVLHKNDEKKKLFIIDGQQRLTTLSILYYVINGRVLDSDKLAIEYKSEKSAKNIKQAQRIFEEKKDQWPKEMTNIFNKITMTYITTSSADLAFTFFDTQNNRGVKLYPTDLLKEYHLRAIGNVNNIDIQKRYAEGWEKRQSYEKIFGYKEDFTAQLFTKFLWRARKWFGQKNVNRETEDEVLEEFQENTRKNERHDTVPLYANQKNTLGEKLIMKAYEGYEIQPVNIEVVNSSANLPFTLRQPLDKGLNFFLFTEKYSDIISHLFIEESIIEIEIKALRNFYTQVWSSMSIYLKELFVLSVLIYYDKFGSAKLLEFSLWLDYALGSIRVNKQLVMKQAPLNFLKDHNNNLLDVISQAFLPEEVILFLKNLTSIKDIYTEEEIEIGVGVRGVYKRNILKYYNKEIKEDKNEKVDKNKTNAMKSILSERDTWITEDLLKEKRNEI